MVIERIKAIKGKTRSQASMAQPLIMPPTHDIGQTDARYFQLIT